MGLATRILKLSVSLLRDEYNELNYLVSSLPKLIKKRVDIKPGASLHGQQEEPSNEIGDRFVELNLSEGYSYPKPDIDDQDALADPLVEALEETRSVQTAMTAASMMQHESLGQKPVKRSRALLINKVCDSLAILKLFSAFKMLRDEIRLDREPLS